MSTGPPPVAVQALLMVKVCSTVVLVTSLTSTLNEAGRQEPSTLLTLMDPAAEDTFPEKRTSEAPALIMTCAWDVRGAKSWHPANPLQDAAV